MITTLTVTVIDMTGQQVVRAGIAAIGTTLRVEIEIEIQAMQGTHALPQA